MLKLSFLLSGVCALALANQSDGVCRFGRALNGLPTTEADAIQCSTDGDCPTAYKCTVSTYGDLKTITVCCPRMAVWAWLPGRDRTVPPPPLPDLPIKAPPIVWTLQLCPFGQPLGKLPTRDEDAIQCATNAQCPRGYQCTVGGPYLHMSTIAMCCPSRLPRPATTTRLTPPDRTYDDRCLAEPSKSPCWQSGRARIGWYFNMTTQVCAAFVYSQCQMQNIRPFKTKTDCESICLWQRPPPTTTTPIPTTTTTTTKAPETRKVPVVVPVRYFKEPVQGYANCPHRTPCAMANPCNSGSFCPPYPEAKCDQSYCHGCLAEFKIDGRRVNCSSNAEADLKVGRCPGLNDGFIVCDPQFYIERPEPVLCSADAECPLSQKCCPDACYQGVHNTCQWPVL